MAETTFLRVSFLSVESGISDGIIFVLAEARIEDNCQVSVTSN